MSLHARRACLGSPLNRRSFLHVGFVGGLGLTLDQYLRLNAAQAAEGGAPAKGPKAEACIHIYLPGGMAHQESFDPKPYAPVEYRGDMGMINTKLDGVQFNECLKETAQVADKICVVRSMTHGEAAHERGTHNMFTGYRPSPAIKFPSFGSVVSHELGVRNNLPPYVAIPTVPSTDAQSGYLSSAYGPFALGADPASGNFKVRDLALPGDVAPDRFTSRRSMLDAVNAHFAGKEKSDNLDAMDTFYQRAYGLISSEKARDAFDINKEDAKLRDAYGRNPAGQRMLMARRLVESGVRFVTLTYGGWDFHNGITKNTQRQLPAFDQAFAMLIKDLSQRGMLEKTLVMVSSEFGRTPKINGTAGRDHWPKVFSVVLAGGGTKPGLVYGKSDATASEPDEDGLTVEDLAHTVYHCLGIDADKRLMSPGDRPIDIVRDGHTPRPAPLRRDSAMPSPAARRLPAGALALLLAAGLAPAASPILSSISPHGGPRGADVTLTFGGQNLGDAVEVLALEPGIAVTKVEPNAAGNAVTVAVKIAPDCRLGEHGFRLRCKGGVSDLRTFWVGTLPTVDEKEPNSEFLKPQPVPLNSTVHGKIDNEDVDYYAVPCKKGQRLSVALEGIRLGATQLWDPAVAILDSKRFELATSDDHPLAAQDCLCSAIVPADGTYVVAVREASYAAGSNYRLHVGTFPTPHAVIPAGGRPGEELTVRFLGDPAGEIQQKVKLPKEADSRFRVHCETADGVCPVGFRFRVLDLPNVTESGSNTSAATATVGSAPGAFHGVIAKPGESRCFKFAAKKGQAFELNCHARMLGSPLDPVLYVGKASGGTIAGDDDSGGGPDSLIRFNVPEDGDYVITVVDHLKAGGPNYFFRVEVAPAPAFAQVTIPRVDGNNPQNQERQALAIPRGGRFATLATVTRQNVGGAMALTLDGLPAGVSVAADALDAGQSNLPVVLEAKADAPLAAGLARFTAAPADGKPAAFESRTLLEACFAPGQNNQPYWKFDQPRVAAAVVEEAPYSIEVLEPKAAVPQNGSMNLKIRAVRKGDFKGAISIQPLWTPPGMGIAGAGTIAEGQTETTLAMNANGNAPAKKWKTAVLASAATPKGVVWTSSQLFALEVSPPLVGLEMQRAATEQGQPSSVFAKVTVNAPFPGEATVKLLGLPAKVAAPDQKLKADTKELTFPVTTAKESPAGKHGVFCQVVVTLNGEEVAQSAGSAELRIDVPIPPKAAPVAAAKPAEPAKPAAPKPAEPKRLSRLEQLRLEQEAKEKGGK